MALARPGVVVGVAVVGMWWVQWKLEAQGSEPSSYLGADTFVSECGGGDASFASYVRK